MKYNLPNTNILEYDLLSTGPENPIMTGRDWVFRTSTLLKKFREIIVMKTNIKNPQYLIGIPILDP